jgi:hypothetical protein
LVTLLLFLKELILHTRSNTKQEYSRHNDYRDINDLLKKSTSVLILDLLNLQYLLNEEQSSWFIQPEMGLYRKGDIKPFIPANDPRFKDKDYKDKFRIEPLININLLYYLTQYVVDYFIPLSNLGIKPRLIGLRVIDRMDYLSDPIHGTDADKLEVKRSRDSILEELFHKSIIRQLEDFVGHDIHHIYFVKIVGISLFIEKFIDFRIYDWYEKVHFKDQED